MSFIKKYNCKKVEIQDYLNQEKIIDFYYYINILFKLLI